MITYVNFWEATEQTHKQADRQAGREHASTNKSLDIIACSLTHRHDNSHIFGLYRTITNTHIGLWLCIGKVASMECGYVSNVIQCEVDMNGRCQLDAGVLCCADYRHQSSNTD